MDPLLFGKSLALGLAVAAPLGPIGALCINRTLARGFQAGVAGGLGTALADGIYAALAAIGFAAFSATLSVADVPLQVVGGAFMLWLGFRGLQPAPSEKVVTVGTRDLVETVAATFTLTIVNPMTIIAFAAMFAGLGLAERAEWVGAATVTAGVFLGSLLWWAILSGGVALAGRHFPSSFARAVSLFSSGTLFLFGICAIATAIYSLSSR